MAASIIHIPLAPMTLEINAVSSEYVTWTVRYLLLSPSRGFSCVADVFFLSCGAVYMEKCRPVRRFRNVCTLPPRAALPSRTWLRIQLTHNPPPPPCSYSPNFGHPDGWVWRMLFQQNVDAAGNRVYGIFLYVVMTDNELQERTWTRDIRSLQFCILNSEARQLKDKTTIALYRENQLSWGFPGLLDNSILLRDPVVNNRRTIDILCRLRYHPKQEKLRRPMSPTIPASLRSTSIIGNAHSTSRTAPNPASYWDQQKAPHTAADSVGKHLKKLLNNPEFSDLEIVVGPREVVLYAHKAILAARSDWFRSALRSVFKEAREGKITIPDDNPKIFEPLLEFLYTGEYPLSSLENNVRAGSRAGTVLAVRPQSPVHLSLRSPPTIPPRVVESSSPAASSSSFASSSNSSASSSPASSSSFASSSNSFASSSPASSSSSSFTEAPSTTRDNSFESEPDEDEELDDQKFQLFLMADKYGVTQLKTLIRLHLTNDLLDTSNNVQPGQRLIRLIRFAFEELPESTRSHGRDSGVGNSLAYSISERGLSPSYPFDYSAAATNGFPFNEPVTRQSPVPTLGHESGSRENSMPTLGHESGSRESSASDSEGGGVGGSVATGRRSPSQVSHAAEYAGIYGRDNETTLLRESITSYVAKMFLAVRKLAGFEDLLREGGEMGAFAMMVMESMYRP